MVIVIVIDVYNQISNGTVISARHFVQELRSRGHEVRIVSTEVAGEFCYSVEERKIPIVSKVAKKQKIVFGKPDKEVLRKAMQGADIVHCYLPFKLEKAAVQVAKEMGIPCMGAFHLVPEGITYSCWFKKDRILPKMIYTYYKNTFYKYFEHIHCPSKFTADKLIKFNYKAQLHVISNGVAEKFVPPKQKMQRTDSYFRILAVGRYAVDKRHDVLIRAVAKSKYKDNIKLTLCGVGPLENKLKRLSQKLLPIESEFKFCNQEELVQTMYKNDLYVHASDVESEAIACIEAISTGLVPIIAKSPISAASQFALDERSLFKAGKVDKLVEKIDYWIENKQERERMSIQYGEWATQFTLAHSVTQMEKVFQEVIAEYNTKKRIK